ncbi:hypothetical protein PINS_up000058 [Pythium insidiosum]|nr:hypothetical protein PINS_up000058 [Pythium insidiosum]
MIVRPPTDAGGSSIQRFAFMVNGVIVDALQEGTSQDGRIFSIYDLLATSQFSITVQAVNSVGPGPWAPVILAVTSDATVPGPPLNVSVTSRTFESIVVAWQAPYDKGGTLLTGYNLEWSTLNDPTTPQVVDADSGPISLSGLLAATEYVLRVRAVSAVGNGMWSDGIVVRTDPISPGELAFDVPALDVREDRESQSVPVRRSKGGALPARCRFTVSSRTATLGKHFVLAPGAYSEIQTTGTNTSGVLSFASGVLTQNIVIGIINNAVVEDPEPVFSITLAQYDDFSGTIGSNPSIVITIRDDGDAGTFQFEKPSYVVSEALPYIDVTITRANGQSTPVDLQVDALERPGGARLGIDFSMDPIVSFNDQQQRATLRISISNDGIFQFNKPVLLQLRSLRGRAIMGQQSSSRLDIIDDGDVSPPDAPQELAAMVTSGSSVNVTWRVGASLGVGNATGLLYSVRVTSRATGIAIQSNTAALSLMITQLTARTEYEIAVSAANQYLSSAFTEPPVVVRTLNPTMPSAPQAVRFTAITGGSFNVSWSPPDDSGGAPIILYRVFITIKGNTVSQMDTRSTSVVVFNLRPVTIYSVQIQAVNDEGMFGVLSEPTNVTTPSATIPGRPPTPTVTRVTGGAIYLTVRPPLDTGGLNITAYVVFATSASLPSVFSEVYRGSDPNMVFSRLVFLTEYKMRSRVITDAGPSDVSDVLSVTTTYLSLPSPPQRIQVLARSAGSTTLQWEPPLDQGGSVVTRYSAAYFIGYDARLQYEMSVDSVSPTAVTVVSRVPRLMANTTYGFIVIGVNDVTACADPTAFLNYSAVFVTTTSVSAPEPPDGLAVSFSSTGLQVIRWDPPVDGGGDTWIAYVLFGVDNSNVSQPLMILYNGSLTEFRRGGLKANTLYNYTVVAYNSIGTSQRTTVISKRTGASKSVPGVPTGIRQQSASGGTINVTWTPPLDTGGDDSVLYQLYRDQVALFSPSQGLLARNWYLDSGLTASQQYVYVVRASNSIGLGPTSAAFVTQTTVPSQPSAPRNVSANVTGGSISLAWMPPLDTGGIAIEGYKLSVTTISDGVIVMSTTTSGRAYTYFGATAATSYLVTVSSTNKIGDSPTTATLAVQTLAATRPTSPPAPVVVSVTAQSVTLSLIPPQDMGGAPLTAMRIYQDGKMVRSVATAGRVQTIVSGLLAETVYTFSTAAISVLSLGESDQSLPVVAMTAQATAPSVLYSFAVVGRLSTSLVLSWQGPDESGGQPVSFELEYYDDTSGQTATVIAPSSPFELANLTSSTSYFVRVRARNDAGSSQWAGPLAAQTDVARRGVVVFRPNNITVPEDVGEVSLHLIRVDGSAGTLSCRYYSSVDPVAWGIVATDGRDFLLDDVTQRDLVFADGETHKTVTIHVINNDVYDVVPRVVALVIEDTTIERTVPVPVSLGFVNLADDGDAGAVEFVLPAVSVSESAGSMFVDLRRVNGSSSAITVRVSVDLTMGATARAPDDFGLSKTDYGFGDGETSQRISVVIRGNTVYDYPYKWFALTLSILSGGGCIGDQRVVVVTIEDDGDRSVPGVVTDVTITRATGGLVQLAWSPPENVGGRDIWIDRYVVTYAKRGSSLAATVMTPTNASEVPVGGLDATTEYSFQIEAVNSIGKSAKSTVITGRTTNVTRPSAPLNVSVVRATGGLLQLLVDPPIDTGGVPLLGYKMFVWNDETQSYQVRRTDCYFDLVDLKPSVIIYSRRTRMIRWEVHRPY